MVFDRHPAAPIVVVSHADHDHLSLVPGIMGDREPHGAWLGGNIGNYRTSAMKDWLRQQLASRVRYGFPAGWSNGGQAVSDLDCGDPQVDVLTVNVKNGSSKNSRSLVARIRHGNFSIVFSGTLREERKAAQ